eukprot:gene1031-1118_t
MSSLSPEMESFISSLRLECLTATPTTTFFPALPSYQPSTPWESRLPLGTIMIDLSLWWSWLSDEVLVYLQRKKTTISLQMSQLEPAFPLSLLEKIGSFLGSALYELVIERCPQISWQEEVKILLRRCGNLSALTLIGQTWVDDNVLEQLSLRYQKTLGQLSLVDCPNMTNNGLFQIGRRCQALQRLKIVSCRQISDAGILELTKKIQLQHIEISHNWSVTDRSIGALVGNAKDLLTLTLVNCPKLTDTTLSWLYETQASWGKKRNLAGITLKELILTDNSHYTAQVLLFLSTSAVGLERLDLRQCPSLDPALGLKELTNLNHLNSILLGPSKVKDTHLLIEGLHYHNERLKTLHLVEIDGFSDELLGQLLDPLWQLEELVVDSLPFGTTSIESLCSNIPNIARLSIINSSFFGDAELRCLTSVCLHLTDLRLTRCPRLTDGGFVRFIGLKLLAKLNLSYISPQCTTNLLKSLTVSPLTDLVLDGLTLSVRESFAFLRRDRSWCLQTLSLKQCKGMTIEDISYLLRWFPACQEVDLTLVTRPSLDQLKALPHGHPFLSFFSSPDFSGYRLDERGKREYKQYWSFFTQCQRHHCARRIQTLYHHYKRRCEELKAMRRERWDDFKIYLLTRIQALVRGYQERKVLRKKMLAGRRIVRAARDYLFYQDYLKHYRAKIHYRTALKKKLWNHLWKFHQGQQLKCGHAQQQIMTRHGHRIQKRYFRQLKRMMPIIQELKFEYSALIFWETNFLSKILKHWHQVVFHSSNHNQDLVRIFMMALPMTVWNSNHHQQVIGLANSFRNRRLLIIAWMVLADDRLAVKRAERLEPTAVEHFQKSFFRRVCGLIVSKWAKYVKTRLWKRQRKVYGEYMCKQWRYEDFIEGWKAYAQHRLQMKQWLNYGLQHHPHYYMRFYFLLRWVPLTRNKFVYHALNIKAKQQHRYYLHHHGLELLKKGVVRSRIWRIMMKRATIVGRRHYYRPTFNAWKEFKTFSHNLELLYIKRYQDRLVRRIWRDFKEGIAISKEVAKQLALELAQQLEDQAAFDRAIRSLILFQAQARRFITSRRFNRDRIEKLYALQILQNFFRTFLARRQYASRLKKADIAEKVREDNELERMRQEEVEMRYYLYHVKAVVNIQRLYRGLRDRRLAAQLAIEYFRDKQKAFYEEGLSIRWYRQAYLRLVMQQEQQRQNAATEINRVARGFLARKRFVLLKHHKLMVEKAIIVQTWYRGVLSRLKLAAMKRDRYHEIRFHIARDRRGLILRLMGIRKRKAQFRVGKFLSELGLDPMTFQHQVSVLIQETKEDFNQFVEVLKREYRLWKEHGMNQLNKMLERRRLLTEHPSHRFKLTKGQAVKIVEFGHKYEGYTGVISRIDDGVPGNPLYEVVLDRFYGAQTYVRMTTDPLKIYEINYQPLVAIDSRPILSSIQDPRHHGSKAGGVVSHQVFGLHPEDSFYSRKNVIAAWKIQCAYRIHRARSIVARKRYEHWKQNIMRQRLFLHHFSQSNSLNMHGYIVGKSLLSILPKKLIFFNEIRHKLLPQRFLAVATKLQEKNVIRRELDGRIRDRQKFMQKAVLTQSKEVFLTGHEKFTRGKHFRHFMGRVYGMFYLSPRGLGEVGGGGARGVRYLTGRGKQSLIAGMDQFTFQQFENSPHVRYYKTQLYQGEWTGLPLITPLRPHGEGTVVFLDGWGFAKEDKVVYLTVLACRHLNAMDVITGASDPYCEIRCNGHTVQTTVKYASLNPSYHEQFEIDVTNPAASLQIIVKDKDFFGSDDFMGQVILKLADYSDGRSYHLMLPLKGETVGGDKKKSGNAAGDGREQHQQAEDDGFDRGEIELRLRWAERKDDDDYAKQQLRKEMLVRLQRWVRWLASKKKVYQLRDLRERNILQMHQAAIKITTICRVRLAKKDYRRRLRRRRAAIKIQKRVRIWIAKRIYRHKLLHNRMAIRIQTTMRVYLAKSFVARMKSQAAADLNADATTIQKNIRRYLAIKTVTAMRIFHNQTISALRYLGNEHEAKDNTVGAEAKGNDELILSQDASLTPPPVVLAILPKGEGILSALPWLITFGVDNEYGYKRTRRIAYRLFQSMLRRKYARLVSRFGVVYVDAYPPRKHDDDGLEDVQSNERKDGEEPVDFVSVYLPPFQPLFSRLSRPAAVSLLLRYEHLALLHLPTSVYLNASVNLLVSTVQCAYRQHLARKARKQMIQMLQGIILFQRLFRKRYEVFHRASISIASLFRMIRARRHVGRLLHELHAAQTIQRGFRCYFARCCMFNFRSVAKLSVLKASPPSVERHGPEKCLEHRDDTYWLAIITEDPSVPPTTIEPMAELRVELAKYENIVEIWIQTGTFATSPRFLTIAAVTDKKSGSYTELVDRWEMPFLPPGRSWQKFSIGRVKAKYFMCQFMGNYGDENYIAVRQIRFIRSKECSATIVKEPAHYILSPGPHVDEHAGIVLKVGAEGWPAPTFQWYRNGKIIPGATKAELELTLYSPIHGHRAYRCVRCKMVARSVPANAYHIICGNCSYQFTYREIEEFDKTIHHVHEEEDHLLRSKSSLQASIVQIEALGVASSPTTSSKSPNRKDPKNTSVLSSKYTALLQDARERLEEVEGKLQQLREKRVAIKQTMHYVNHFSNEGVYVCEVRNIRGGSQIIVRRSRGAVVLVERPAPYLITVQPLYTPRRGAIRKKWTIYASLIGTFRLGQLAGLCRIRYTDGSFYEGPYLDEHAIDSTGQTIPSRRAANHFGLFRTSDGRVFEGHNVDNHFDITNLQTFYRLRLPNKEIYEGMFVDEMYHGVGQYIYADGSVYEGQWHRGTRFGHGTYRSMEGWTYEGFWDTNRRHRRGIQDHPDGSCYMGEWFYDAMTGKGIYITKLKDIYRGEVVNGKFHGQGQLIYADGSIYTGSFANGIRHGRGIFIEKEGQEYYGHFHEDLYHGEMVVKLLIPIEEPDQDNYEIRIGIFEKGELVRWKVKFSHPIATKQFITLFRTHRDMFDSVYSMLLAKHLPNLPEGIDGNNKQVKKIVRRLRMEAGLLVGEEAYHQAQAAIQKILGPLAKKQEEIAAVKAEMEKVSSNMVMIEKESSHFYVKCSHHLSRYDKATLKIEQFWQDDPKESRYIFIEACRKLYTISMDEYFSFRNHRAVPVFVRRIVDAISYLLNREPDWKDQQMLLSDAASNARAGEDEALRLNYHCKLAYLCTFGMSAGGSGGSNAAAEQEMKELSAMLSHPSSSNNSAGNAHPGASTAPAGEPAAPPGPPGPKKKKEKKESGEEEGGKSEALSLLQALAAAQANRPKYFDPDVKEEQMGWGFDIFRFVKLEQEEKLSEILADTRFRTDSYYIHSTGVAGPVLVGWVKATYSYLLSAREMERLMQAAQDDRTTAYRYRVLFLRKQEELQEANQQLQSLQNMLLRHQNDLQELEHALIKAKDLLDFIVGRYQLESQERREDYYKAFEERIEAKRDRFEVEVSLQAMVDQVVQRIDREKYIKRLQAFGTGADMAALEEQERQDEEAKQHWIIVNWLRDEVLMQQQSILSSGRSLGYSLEPLPSDVSRAYTEQVVCLIAEVIIGRMNDKYNDLATSRQWISLRGNRFTARFVYIHAWKIWEEEALVKRDADAMAAWESIFGDIETCARSAIEAKVNERMSSVARAQGKIWADRHRQDVAYAESNLAGEFLAYFNENVKEAAEAALTLDRRLAAAAASGDQQTGPGFSSSSSGGAEEGDLAAYDNNPTFRAQALCFRKLYPEAYLAAKDACYVQYADEFNQQYGQNAAMTAYQLLNGIPTAQGEDDLVYQEHAVHWKDFHIEEYEAAGKLILEEMSADFVELYPIHSATEAARLLFHTLLLPYLYDEEAVANYGVPVKHLPLAQSYATLHQGLVRAARTALITDYRNQNQRNWQDLISQTQNFTKGSALLANTGGDEGDRFAGFRARLLSKFSFLYAFLMYQHDDLLKELERHELRDPLDRVLHRVRPSQMKETLYSREHDFLQTREELQDELKDVVEKLSTWNSYFGWANQQGADNNANQWNDYYYQSEEQQG